MSSEEEFFEVYYRSVIANFAALMPLIHNNVISPDHAAAKAVFAANALMSYIEKNSNETMT